jgi:uncharacterized protein
MEAHMIEQVKARRIQVMISLDGVGAIHDQQRPFRNGQPGSFALADRSISRLLANHLRPCVNVTVSQHNLGHLQELLAYLLERDLRFNLSYYRETDCTVSRLDLLFAEEQMIRGMHAIFAWLEQVLPRQRILDGLIDKASIRAPHQYACGAGRNFLVISQRGEVATCQADLTDVVTTIQARDMLSDVQQKRSGVGGLSSGDLSRHWQKRSPFSELRDLPIPFPRSGAFRSASFAQVSSTSLPLDEVRGSCFHLARSKQKGRGELGLAKLCAES